MKEKDLIELGFEKCFGEPDEPVWYYYTYDFGNRSFSLITNASDEVVDGKWVVDVFEDDSISFTDKEDIQQLIKVIEKNTKKS